MALPRSALAGLDLWRLFSTMSSVVTQAQRYQEDHQSYEFLVAHIVLLDIELRQ
ncbi:MAG: hypothetical protein WBW81_07040 [Methylocella sp.]